MKVSKETGRCINCNCFAIKHIIEARKFSGYWKYDFDKKNAPRVKKNRHVKLRRRSRDDEDNLKMVSYNWLKKYGKRINE